MSIFRTAASIVEERSSQILSLLSALKQASQTKNLEAGKKHHLAAVQAGHDSNLHVSTSLLDMYTRCGRLHDARKLFDTIPHPPHHPVTWNILISGYAQAGHTTSALTLFSYMYLEGCIPDSRTFVSALSACSYMASQPQFSRLMSLHKGMSIHSQAVEARLSFDRYVATALVNMYSECGSMLDARTAFDRIESHDTVSWNALILGYVTNGDCFIALELFQYMITGCQPDERTFVAALKACTGLSETGRLVKPMCLSTGTDIHKQAASTLERVSDCNYLSNTLVDMYSKCGSISEARRVFDNMTSPDVVSWTAMISGYSDNREEDIALELFKAMNTQGVAPNRATYVAIIGACSHLAEREQPREVDGRLIKVKSLQTGMKIHSESRNTVEQEIYVASSLIEMYGKSGSLADARRVFDRMKAHDVVSWTALISGYALNGEGELALELFTSMQRQGKCLPDSRSFVAAVLACSDVEKLRELELQAVKDGYIDLKRQTFVSNTLSDTYSRSGSFEDARRVFELLKYRDIVSWTVIILGHAQNGEAECALELFSRLFVEKACQPDGPVYAAALIACRILTKLELGRNLHAEINRQGLECNGALAACLVHFYGRCGECEAAERTFESVCDGRLVAAWNGLVAGYSFQGDVKKVVETVRSMVECLVAPDEATFVSVLSACSHAGLVEMGRKVLKRMECEYGVLPNARHYACVVDMLSRASRLKEAVEMVGRMPGGGEGKEGVLPWMSVLGGCQEWMDVEVGEVAFRGVMQVDERRPAAYNLISNIYRKKTAI